MYQRKNNAVLITWNRSRRSQSLARKLSLRLLEIQPEGPAIFRFTKCTLWTAHQLILHRPTTVLIQYSYLLLIILSIYKAVFKKNLRIICDCHTKALRRKQAGFGRNLFLATKKWSFSYCELCIIHNNELAAEAQEFTNNFLVLHDPVPLLAPRKNGNDAHKASDKNKIVFVCSYASDEPIDETLAAAKQLPADNEVFMTGTPPKSVISDPSNKVNFTGFLDDDAYIELLDNADVIVGLTKENGTLQCSAFEAMAINKPFVTSDTQTLRNLLGKSAIYVSNSPASIVEGITAALESSLNLKKESANRMCELEALFDEKSSMIRIK